MYRLLFALVLILAGCGGSSDSNPDGGAGGDGGGGGGGDGGGGGVICTGTSPTVVSQLTRPRMSSPQVATDGSSTMAIWAVYPGAGYLKSMWAQLKGGVVVASGDLASGGSVFTFKSRFYLFQSATALYAFDGAGWVLVPGFSGINAIAVSATQILGVGGINLTNAVLFDGTTTSAPQKISSFPVGAAASDGTGFGVATVETVGTNKVTLHYLTYNGSTWSAESTIATATVPAGASTTALTLASSAGLWCLAGYGYLSASPTAWVLSGGTWTSTVLPFKGTASLLANQGTFAVTTSEGSVATYKAGTWTTTNLSMTPTIFTGGALAAYGSGYVYIAADAISPPAASFYNGTSWGPATPLSATLGSSGIPTLAAAGATLGLGFGTKVVTYDGSAFTEPFAVATQSAINAGGMTLTIEGSDVVAVYPQPGLMASRRRTQGSWSAPLTLPASPTSGSVAEAVLARAGNGHALAVWTQWDIGAQQPYAAEYDGCNWGPAVLLTGLMAPYLSVAATGSTFVIGSQVGTSQVAKWTGSGITPPQNLGQGALNLSSDGTTFVATWIASGNVMSATSSDGVTWTAAQQVEAGPGWSLGPLRGGPLGVLGSAYNPGRTPNTSARLWQAGTWSAPVLLDAFNGTGTAAGLYCQLAVAAQSALIVCSSATTADSELFTGGAWTKVPIGSDLGNFTGIFRLASDGTDYRIDYGPTIRGSAVLHAGAWSKALVNPTFPVSLADGVAGKAGVWTAMAQTAPTGDVFTVRATGAASYDATTLTKLSPTGGPFLQSFTGQSSNTDAAWLSLTPALPGVPMLVVALDL